MNDKAGFIINFYCWVFVCFIKENFNLFLDYCYFYMG